MDTHSRKQLNTHTHTHTSRPCYPEAYGSFEIEWRQTRPFCWIAPRASTLLEVLPNKLNHTHTNTLNTHIQWLAALPLVSMRNERRHSFVFLQERRAASSSECNGVKWKLRYLWTGLPEAYSATLGPRLVFVHYTLAASVAFCLIGCLIMKITSQIDFFLYLLS